MNALKFADGFKAADDVMVRSEYEGEMSTNQEKIMQEISKENVDIKFKIDACRREHQEKLITLRERLGLAVPLEALLKTKGNQRELQAIKDHKEQLDRTESFGKQNKEIERKIEAIAERIEEDELARREIQEGFS